MQIKFLIPSDNDLKLISEAEKSFQEEKAKFKAAEEKKAEEAKLKAIEDQKKAEEEEKNPVDIEVFN